MLANNGLWTKNISKFVKDIANNTKNSSTFRFNTAKSYHNRAIVSTPPRPRPSDYYPERRILKERGHAIVSFCATWKDLAKFNQ